MFNYKTWRLWSPYDPLPQPTDEVNPVVDENGNSITPDSLKKNMTIPPEEPANDLEKTLDNMNGADPTHEINSSSGLIDQLTRMEGSRGSGGILLVHDSSINNEHTLDKTYAEIEAAYNAGMNVWIVYDGILRLLMNSFEPVHLDRASPQGVGTVGPITSWYVGSVAAIQSNGELVYWVVSGENESEVKNSYPFYTELIAE